MPKSHEAQVVSQAVDAPADTIYRFARLERPAS